MADVEIAPDEYGRPLARGSWTNEIDQVPSLSMAHTRGLGVALLAESAGCGIDVEWLDRDGKDRAIRSHAEERGGGAVVSLEPGMAPDLVRQRGCRQGVGAGFARGAAGPAGETSGPRPGPWTWRSREDWSESFLNCLGSLKPKPFGRAIFWWLRYSPKEGK